MSRLNHLIEELEDLEAGKYKGVHCSDTEAMHERADMILLEIIQISIQPEHYRRISSAFIDMEKWYA